ncbi:MAG: hypothetical protein OEV40_19960 [Acidimicrobiia bacterium]|nr:hypothetical protein [Acidimicrobiia bacterium]
MSSPVDGRLRQSAPVRLTMPVAALAAAALVVVIVGRSAETYPSLAIRVELVAVFLLALGIAVRSERAVAVATAPAMGGLIVATVGSDGIAWGASLLVGCLWYVAVEAGLASIEWGGGLRITPAVLQRRLQEVAVVVAAAAAVGLIGLLVASAAPERSLLVRILLLASVLAGLAAAARHLLAADPPDRTNP